MKTGDYVTFCGCRWQIVARGYLGAGWYLESVNGVRIYYPGEDLK